MNPNVLESLGYPISSYGIMAALGLWFGAYLMERRFREVGENPGVTFVLLPYALLGGLLGSRLHQALSAWAWLDQPLAVSLLSWGGYTWYGALVGGASATLVGARIQGLSLRRVLDAGAVGLPFGQALGRIGCFLVGDDYGRPTELPWGFVFPQGAPPTFDQVHPTQIYECCLLVLVGLLLLRRRNRSRLLFAEYLILAGAGRFLIEIIRVNPQSGLGLTEAQWIALGAVTLGATGLRFFVRERTTAMSVRRAQ